MSPGGKRAPRRMREIGAQLFGDLRRQAESVISAKINDELDTKLRHKFDWSMVEARGITRYRPNIQKNYHYGFWF